MKNPIAYFKHLVKDPVNTMQEAEARQKEIMIWLYSSAGVLAVGIILQIVTNQNFVAILSFVGLVGVVFFWFLLGVIKAAKERFKALTCDECDYVADIATPEEFDQYVSFVVRKDVANISGYSGNKEPTNGVYSLVKFSGVATAVLSVRLICPNCGAAKHLRYSASPFKCHAERRKVGVYEYTAVCDSLETAVRTAVNDYNDPNKRAFIPYTFHSSKNPNFEDRYKFKGANGEGALPQYMGAKIDYHKDVEEMLEHYIVLRELKGSLYVPQKQKRSR